MCEAPSWRLELRLLSPHSTNTYTCGVTIAPRATILDLKFLANI